MTYEIQACSLVASPVAMMRARMPRARIAAWLRHAYRSVADRLVREGTATAGPAFARYTIAGDQVEVEAGYPVAVAVAGDGLVVPSGLPGGPAAVTIHDGGLELIDEAYRQIEHWLAARGFVPSGRHWERYLAGVATGEGDPIRWRTELVVPYCWTRWVPMNIPERTLDSTAMLVPAGR